MRQTHTEKELPNVKVTQMINLPCFSLIGRTWLSLISHFFSDIHGSTAITHCPPLNQYMGTTHSISTAKYQDRFLLVGEIDLS